MAETVKGVVDDILDSVRKKARKTASGKTFEVTRKFDLKSISERAVAQLVLSGCRQYGVEFRGNDRFDFSFRKY